MSNNFKLGHEYALTFDDITLVPKRSKIKSRSVGIDTSVRLTRNFKMDIPIIASPMDTVCEWEMASVMALHGGVGVLHRFMHTQHQLDQVRLVRDNIKLFKRFKEDYKGTIFHLLDMYEKDEALRKVKKLISNYPKWSVDLENAPIAAAIGIKEEDRIRANELTIAGVNVLMVDVAHAHHDSVEEMMKFLNDLPLRKHFDVLVGTVATPDAVRDLIEWGADGIHVGIGGGSLCETRIRAGVGIPMVTSIEECVHERDLINSDIPISCNGGIRNPSDMDKAIALGSDTVVLGSLLAGTKETPGDFKRVGLFPEEQIYKPYNGSASIASKAMRGEHNHIEGNSRLVSFKGKASRILTEMIEGLRSSMSYLGSSTVEEYQANTDYIKITPAGQVEAKPHLLMK